MKTKPSFVVVVALSIVAGILLMLDIFIFRASPFYLGACTIFFGVLVIIAVVAAIMLSQDARAGKAGSGTRRDILVSAVLSVFIILEIAAPVQEYRDWHVYDRTFERHSHNATEALYITQAEQINYTAILSVDRYNMTGYRNQPPKGYPNYIDGEVIGKYSNRIANAEKDQDWGVWRMSYKATAGYVRNVVVSVSGPSFGEYRITADGGLNIHVAEKNQRWGASAISALNETGYQAFGDGSYIPFEKHIGNGTLVKSTLDYGYSIGPTAGMGFLIEQYVLFSDSGKASLVSVERHEWVS